MRRARSLEVADADAEAERVLQWLSAAEWNAVIEDAGLVVEALYGWFDGRPFDGGEDMIWVCRPPRATS